MRAIYIFKEFYMAKTNLLAQNDDLALEQIKASVGRSVMNLSHSLTMPVDVNGAIEIICCIECVPSDAFEITVEALLRQLSPLKVPIMTNFRLNTAFYYCDNRLGWKKWDRFMTGGRSGNEVYEVPKMYNCYLDNPSVGDNKYTIADRTPSDSSTKINYSNSIHTQLGICLNHDFVDGIPEFDSFPSDNAELPLAFAAFDYQMICRDYYTNVDRLPLHPKPGSEFDDYDDIDSDWSYSNLFPSDEDQIKLVDGPSYKSGFNTDDDLEHSEEIKGFILDKKRYHNVRDDYFTSSKKAPMRGDPPTLTAQQNVVLPSGTQIKVNLNNTNFRADLYQTITDQVQPIPTEFEVLYGLTPDSGNVASPLVSKGTNFTFVGSPHVKGQITSDQTLTLSEDTELGSTVITDVTSAELLLLSQLSQWQILNMLHEPYYNDFLNAHFEGVHVGDSPAEKPVYIGGTSQLISINEILQTSQTSDTSPLGNTGATAMSLANNYVGKYYCNNYGYIIGVAYILPDLVYEPAMPRKFSRRMKEDFYSPEFANLSMQATLNKEVFFSSNDEWNNTPWGYTGSFDELRVEPNRIAGDLLNDDYTDLKAWVLRRHFDNDHLPSMSSKFLSIKDNVDKTAFQVPSMPAFMLQVANYIKAVRPMPKIAIPKAL